MKDVEIGNPVPSYKPGEIVTIGGREYKRQLDGALTRVNVVRMNKKARQRLKRQQQCEPTAAQDKD